MLCNDRIIKARGVWKTWKLLWQNPLSRCHVETKQKNLFLDLGLPWQALGKRSGANVSSHYNLYSAAGIKWVMAALWLCVHWTCTLWPSKGCVRWLGGRRWIGSKEQQQQAVFIKWESESDTLAYVRSYLCDLLHSFIQLCSFYLTRQIARGSYLFFPLQPPLELTLSGWLVTHTFTVSFLRVWRVCLLEVLPLLSFFHYWWRLNLCQIVGHEPISILHKPLVLTPWVLVLQHYN